MSFFLVFAYCLLALVRPQEYLSFLNAVPIMMLIQLMAITFWLSIKKSWEPFQLKAVIFLTFFIFLSLVPVSLGDAVSQTVQFIAGQTMVVILLSHVCNSSKRHSAIFMAFIMGAVVMGLHAIYQIASDDKVGWTGIEAMVRHDSGDDPVWQARYVGIFQDPNDMGMVLASSLPLLVYFFFSSKRLLVKAGCLVAAFVVLDAVYLANSRGTILAVLSPFGLYLAIRYNLLKAVLPVLLLLPIIVEILPSRFFVSNDESSLERLAAWYEGYVMFKSNPLLGVGMGNFVDHHYKTAHNSWVLAYAELGFLGFYFWMSLIFTSLFGVYKISRIKPAEYVSHGEQVMQAVAREVGLASATFYGFISVLTSAFFLSRTYTFPLYLFAGLATASYLRARAVIPGFSLRPIQLWVFCLSVGFIVMIALIVLIKGP